MALGDMTWSIPSKPTLHKETCRKCVGIPDTTSTTECECCSGKGLVELTDDELVNLRKAREYARLLDIYGK